MKDRAWLNVFAFPGPAIVCIWFAGSFLDLAPLVTRGTIQLVCLGGVLSWLGLQLFLYRTAVVTLWQNPRRFLSLPHLYWSIYSAIALWSTVNYSDQGSIRPAFYLLIFTLLAIGILYRIANQPALMRIVYVKRLWDVTIFLLCLRVIILFISMIILGEQSVVQVAVEPLTLLRVGAKDFYGYLNPNSVGYIGAILLVVAVNRVLQAQSNRGWWFVIGCIGLAAVLLGYSRTAFVALGVVLIVFLLVQRKFLWLLTILLVGILAITQVEMVANFFLRQQALHEMSNFGNRFAIWQIAWSAIQESPWVGHGYLGGEQQALLAAQLRLHPESEKLRLSSHSAFLSILVRNGLLGLMPVLVASLLTGVYTIRHWLVARTQPGLYRLIGAELLAVVFIFFVSCLTLNGMLYLPTSIRNLPLLALFTFAGLSPALLAAGSADYGSTK